MDTSHFLRSELGVDFVSFTASELLSRQERKQTEVPLGKASLIRLKHLMDRRGWYPRLDTLVQKFHHDFVSHRGRMRMIGDLRVITAVTTGPQRARLGAQITRPDR